MKKIKIRKPVSRAGFWSTLTAVLLICLCGCATKPVMIDPMVSIQNNTGKTINQVVYQECGGKELDWQPISQVAPLPANSYVVFALPVDCADLRAIYMDGRTAGTQQNIKKKFPFRWILY